MQKHPNNGTLKIHNNNSISLAATKPPIQPTQQNSSSNIPTPTQKLSNNFQQALPRYNPPPNPHSNNINSNNINNNNTINNNPARRIQQRGRYSTGTSSLIPSPGSFTHHQTPLASPALSNSTAISSNQDTHQQKSHITFSSRLPSQDMLKFQVRKNETENQNGNTAVPATSNNAQIQSLIAELRALKEANARLMDDNQELRDLCCFLDDDRQKGRKLAREWNRFGRYTASVMRSEVQAYQNKLRQLDEKQQELIRDNLELKELCLYLDEERTRASIQCSNCGASNNGMLRDDGDGSSSSTNADEPAIRYPDYNLRSSNTNAAPPPPPSSTGLVDQTIHYVRSLENKIRELEGRTEGVGNKTPVEIFRALKLLEVREQLDRAANVQQTFKEA